MGGNKVKLSTRKTVSKLSWYTVVTEVNGVVLDQITDKRYVTNLGHIVPIKIFGESYGGATHNTRKSARAAVKTLQGNFPNTEYTGGLH